MGNTRETYTTNTQANEVRKNLGNLSHGVICSGENPVEYISKGLELVARMALYCTE